MKQKPSTELKHIASKYLNSQQHSSHSSTVQQNAPEPKWKRQLQEHDIKIQNARYQMMELKFENQIQDLQQMIDELTSQNAKLLIEKQTIETSKTQEIRKLSIQIKTLEQQLTQANTDNQNFRTQLHKEKQLGTRKETNNDNSFGPAQPQTILKLTVGNSILDFESIFTEENIDYAKYLLEINEDRISAYQSSRADEGILSTVTKQIINLDDLRIKPSIQIAPSKPQQTEQQSQIKNNKTQEKPPQIEQQKPIIAKDKAKTTNNKVSESKTYQQTPELRSQVLAIIMAKLPEEKSLNIKKWIETYIPQIQKTQDLTTNKKFKEDLRKGIPIELRGEVWVHMAGNHLRISPLLYETLLVRVRLAEQNIADDIQFQKNIKVIIVDLHRTFADLGHFREGGILHQPLKNILTAFSMFRTDLGYVQGMSFVAAALLLHIGDEYQTFQTFVNIMHRYLLFTFYGFDMPKVNIIFNVFMRLMKQHIPKLYGAFQELGLQCSVFLFEWVVAVFSNIFSLQLSARLWDQWLFYGEVYFVKICLAICQILWEQVTDKQFEMLIILLKSVANYIKEDALLERIEKISLTEKQYDQLKEDVLNDPKLEKLV